MLFGYGGDVMITSTDSGEIPALVGRRPSPRITRDALAVGIIACKKATSSAMACHRSHTASATLILGRSTIRSARPSFLVRLTLSIAEASPSNAALRVPAVALLAINSRSVINRLATCREMHRPDVM